MGPAHVARTINLQSAGKKASLILGQDIGFQRKETKVTGVVYTKSLLGHVPVQRFQNNFSVLFLFPFFVLYTMASLPFSSSTCGLDVESSFSSSFLPFLESSILSWKAARLLFRHHLHINATRRLAGRHLIRRGQYLKIFVPVHYYLLFDIFPFRFAVGLVRGVILND